MSIDGALCMSLIAAAIKSCVVPLTLPKVYWWLVQPSATVCACEKHKLVTTAFFLRMTLFDMTISIVPDLECKIDRLVLLLFERVCDTSISYPSKASQCMRMVEFFSFKIIAGTA